MLESSEENIMVSILGSHVAYTQKKGFLGSVEEALSYGANTFMFYTGAPQNTARRDINMDDVLKAQQLMKQEGIDISHVVAHAPYIINLANTTKPETFDLAVSFLIKEIERVEQFGVNLLVIHPGSHVGAGEQVGLDRIVEGLNVVLATKPNLYICLETMAGKGKGSELGNRFEQLKYIIDHVEDNSKLAVCLDTCHVHDAGYDLVNDLEGMLTEFDSIIGLDRLKVIHLNDSKNERGAAKDRHENIGKGFIGQKALTEIVYHPRLTSIPKILETPYIDDLPPYKEEISFLKSHK